jgi:hypothetical protein
LAVIIRPIQVALPGGVQTATGLAVRQISAYDVINAVPTGNWSLRERFEGGDIDMDRNDDQLAQRRGDIKLKLTP